jgi:FixJ family two-component response regulator
MISIIDDDLLVRESTADLISSLGHEALIFGSAEQFLASGCLKDTACIITDLHMPGLNGRP